MCVYIVCICICIYIYIYIYVYVYKHKYLDKHMHTCMLTCALLQQGKTDMMFLRIILHSFTYIHTRAKYTYT